MTQTVDRPQRPSYSPPRVRVLGSVHALTESLKLVGESDGLLFLGYLHRGS